MLASEKLLAACNQQVGNEFGASMQYVSIASHFASQSLDNLAAFFFRQADEERDHAMKFVHFIVDTDGQLEIPAIPAPKPTFDSAREAVEAALDWEKEVTSQIYALVEIAREDSNYIALRFLDWFVDEQFEEVNTMSHLLEIVERAGEDGLLHVEAYLARKLSQAGGE